MFGLAIPQVWKLVERAGGGRGGGGGRGEERGGGGTRLGKRETGVQRVELSNLLLNVWRVLPGLSL